MGLKCCGKIWCRGFCCSTKNVGGISDEDMAWMLHHTDYDEKEIRQLYLGFHIEFPLGGISRRQFEKCFTTKNARKMSDVVFKTLDANNSGFLDLREFILAIELVGARTPEEKLTWAFKRFDANNNDSLCPKEVTSAVISIYNMLDVIGARPKENPEEKARKIFRQIDINNDGILTQTEFLRGCMNDAELMLLLEKLFNFLTEGME